MTTYYTVVFWKRTGIFYFIGELPIFVIIEWNVQGTKFNLPFYSMELPKLTEFSLLPVLKIKHNVSDWMVYVIQSSQDQRNSMITKWFLVWVRHLDSFQYVTSKHGCFCVCLIKDWPVCFMPWVCYRGSNSTDCTTGDVSNSKSSWSSRCSLVRVAA